jgi:NAD-reducing hydrogenase small subunit
VAEAIVHADHLEMIRKVRRNTKLLIALGDCAVTDNVTALRNSLHDTLHDGAAVR